MKNKHLFKSILIIAILFTIFLSGCREKEPKVVDIKLNENNPTEILIKNFDYDLFSLDVYYDDGNIKNIKFNEEMISKADYFKTFKQGLQTLTVNYQNKSIEFNLNIKIKEFSGIEVINDSVVYDGEYHSLSVGGVIPTGTKITFPNGNEFKNAGRYPVTAVLANDEYLTKSITGYLTIEKGVYDSNLYSFSNKTETYDGNLKTIAVSGTLPSDATIKYYIDDVETNGKTDAGIYTVTAKINLGQNYVNPSDLTATLTIDKATYDVSLHKLSNKTVTYDGEKVSLEISEKDKLPNGVTVNYVYALLGNDTFTQDIPVNAGTYTCKAIFNGDPNNYNTIDTLTSTLTIKKAKVTLTGVHFDGKKVVFDGTGHTLSYTGTLPTGVSFTGYEYIETSVTNGVAGHDERSATQVGTYLVKAKFSYADTINYEEITPLTAILSITKAEYTSITFEDQTIEYDGSTHQMRTKGKPEGINESYSLNNVKEPGDYKITVSFTLVSGSYYERNYNTPKDLTATLTITKKDIKSSFNNISYTYDEHKKTIEANLNEDEKTWITPYYYYDRDNGNGGTTKVYIGSKPAGATEDTIDGFDEPGSYVIHVDYVIAPDHLEDFNAHYENVTSESAVLTINKIKFDVIENLTNRKISLNGFNPFNSLPQLRSDTFTINGKTEDAFKFYEKYIMDGGSISYSYYKLGSDTPLMGYDSYPEGLYKCVATIKLNKEALKHYYSIPDTEFVFAIKDTSNTTDRFSPVFTSSSVTYDGKVHSFTITELPAGLSVSYANNEQIKADTYQVYSTISFKDEDAKNGDVYKYYYFNLDDNTKTKVYTNDFTINKADLDITFDLGPFKYDGQAKFIKATKVPSFITIYPATSAISSYHYEKDDNNRILPGTYSVTITPTFNDEEMASNYNPSVTVTFEIKKGVAKYTIDNYEVLYDGNSHQVTVKGLPDGITYETKFVTPNSLLTDGKAILPGDYNVNITFTNNTDLYENIDRASITLSIITINADTTSLTTYLNSQGSKTVHMFKTVKDILNSLIDIEKFDISWSAIYYTYDNDSNNYVEETTKKSLNNTILDDEHDYVLSYPTYTDTINNKYGYVYLSFTIKLKTGYTNNQLEWKEDGTYDFVIRTRVTASNPIDISNITTNFVSKYNGTVNQGNGVNNIIKNILGQVNYNKVNISYTVDYYNGNNIYLDDNVNYHGSGSTNKEYYLAMNTWDNRYVRISYTIEPLTGYYLTDGKINTLKYTNYCDVKVNTAKSIDVSFIKEALKNNTISIAQYDSLTDYFKNLIDINNTDFELNIYNNDELYKTLSSTNPNNIISLSEFNGNYRGELTVKQKGLLYFADGSSKIQKQFTIKFTNDNALNVINLNDVVDSSYDGLDEELLMKRDLFKYYLKDITVYPNCTYTYKITDGLTIKKGTIDSFNNQSYILNNAHTSNDFKVEITIKANDGYALLDNNGVNIKETTVTLNFKVKERSAIELGALDNYANTSIENPFNQYDKFKDIFKDYISNLNAYLNSYPLKATLEITYKNSTNPNEKDVFELLDQNILSYQFIKFYQDNSEQQETYLSIKYYIDKENSDWKKYYLIDNNTSSNYDLESTAYTYTVKTNQKTIVLDSDITEVSKDEYIEFNTDIKDLIVTTGFNINSNFTLDKYQLFKLVSGNYVKQTELVSKTTTNKLGVGEYKVTLIYNLNDGYIYKDSSNNYSYTYKTEVLLKIVNIVTDDDFNTLGTLFPITVHKEETLMNVITKNDVFDSAKFSKIEGVDPLVFKNYTLYKTLNSVDTLLKENSNDGYTLTEIKDDGYTYGLIINYDLIDNYVYKDKDNKYSTTYALPRVTISVVDVFDVEAIKTAGITYTIKYGMENLLSEKLSSYGVNNTDYEFTTITCAWKLNSQDGTYTEGDRTFFDSRSYQDGDLNSAWVNITIKDLKGKKYIKYKDASGNYVYSINSTVTIKNIPVTINRTKVNLSARDALWGSDPTYYIIDGTNIYSALMYGIEDQCDLILNTTYKLSVYRVKDSSQQKTITGVQQAMNSTFEKDTFFEYKIQLQAKTGYYFDSLQYGGSYSYSFTNTIEMSGHYYVYAAAEPKKAVSDYTIEQGGSMEKFFNNPGDAATFTFKWTNNAEGVMNKPTNTNGWNETESASSNYSYTVKVNIVSNKTEVRASGGNAYLLETNVYRKNGYIKLGDTKREYTIKVWVTTTT